MPWLAKYAPLVTRLKTVTMFVVVTRDSRSQDSPRNLLDKYSQRSAQRDAAILEFTNSRGRAPTDNEVAVLVRETRADKLQEISTEQVRNLQQERMTPDEKQMLRDGLNEAQSKSQSPQINCRVHEASLAYSQEHIFERLSVAR